MLVRRGVARAASGASRGGEGVMTCSLAGRPQKTSDRPVAFRSIPAPHPRCALPSRPTFRAPSLRLAVHPLRCATRACVLCPDPVRFAEFEVGNRVKSGIKLCKTRKGGAGKAQSLKDFWETGNLLGPLVV